MAIESLKNRKLNPQHDLAESFLLKMYESKLQHAQPMQIAFFEALVLREELMFSYSHLLINFDLGIEIIAERILQQKTAC